MAETRTNLLFAVMKNDTALLYCVIMKLLFIKMLPMITFHIPCQNWDKAVLMMNKIPLLECVYTSMLPIEAPVWLSFHSVCHLIDDSPLWILLLGIKINTVIQNSFGKMFHYEESRHTLHPSNCIMDGKTFVTKKPPPNFYIHEHRKTGLINNNLD